MSCLNCENRTLGCHATCLDYIEETRKRERIKEIRNQIIKERNEYMGYRVMLAEKSRRRIH